MYIKGTNFTLTILLLCCIGFGLVIGIQKYGSEVTEPCKSFASRYMANYKWVFGYPFPAIIKDEMAGDCNGTDNYGFYFIEPWGFMKDLTIWGAAAAIGYGALSRKFHSKHTLLK